MKAAVIPSCVLNSDTTTSHSALCRKIAVAALALLLTSFANHSEALAACASPVGAEGEIIYNDAYNVAQFCNGSDWVSMSGGASAGAESDPQVGATTLNKWCRGDGSGVVCDLNAPLTTESDPKIGTLTASKWCTTNGTMVECNSDLPIGTLTNGKWCTTNGTTISCTTDAPASGGTPGGADTQVQFNDGGTFGGDTSFVWDKTNKRLGIGITAPSAKLEVAGGTSGSNTGILVLKNIGGSAANSGASVQFFNTDNTPAQVEQARVGSLLQNGGAGISASDLAFSTTSAGALAERVRITSNGNVGIGTTGPSEKLNVVGNLRVQDVSNSYGGKLVSTWNGGLEVTGLYGGSAIRFTETEGGTERLRISSSGNVGIGTTSPQQPLDVSGIVRSGDASSCNGATALAIRYGNSTEGATATFGSEYSACGPVLGRNVRPSGSASGAFISATPYGVGRGALVLGDELRYYTGSVQTVAIGSPVTMTERFRIDASGNVGIGTANPTSALHINTNATSNETRLSIGTPYQDTTNDNGMHFYAYSDNNNYIDSKVGTNGKTYYRTGHGTEGGASRNWMTVDGATGNVGIGTMSPAAKLDVSGHVNITNGQIDLSSGYPLRWGGAASSIYGGSGTADLVVSVGSAERLRINGSSGNVGIGTASPGSNRLNVAYSGAGAVTAGIALNDSSASGSGVVFARFQTNGTTIGSVAQSGASAVVYNTTSDRRLKKDIDPTQRGLADLMKIEVDDFEFISDPEGERVQGFIAQQLYEVYPEAVTVGGQDAQTRPWAVDYGRVTPLLVKAVQDLKAANDNLKAENSDLRMGLEDLRREFEALKASTN